MEIKFSRHAKRRAKLYNIPESLITGILSSTKFSKGEHEIIKNIVGFPYPLKVVIAVEEDTVTVITTYPIKEGRQK